MAYTITICANSETILESLDNVHDADLADVWFDKVTAAILESNLEGHLIELDSCHTFSKYHGGKFAQQAKMYGQTGGLVSCNTDAPKVIHDLCDKALRAANHMLVDLIKA